MAAERMQEAAAKLARAFRKAELLEPGEIALPADVEGAYALQRLATDALEGGIAGWKIGATTEAALRMLGLELPFYGPIPSSAILKTGASLACPPGLRGVEMELAFKLGHDLPSRSEPYTRAEIIEAVASLHPAIEMVGSRVRPQGPMRGINAIADFGAHVAFVYGAPVDDWQRLDLATVAARCVIDGEEKASGSASLVMGNPLEALVWLADNGPGLNAGQWISSGSLTGITPAQAGHHVVGDFGPLGSVEIRIETT